MSERAQLARWRDALRDSDLDVRTKCVGHTIATYFNGRGLDAFPSKATIARGAGVSERFVFKATGELEHAGFLQVERTKGGHPNRYAATLPTMHPRNTVDHAPIVHGDQAPKVHGSLLATMHDGTLNHAPGRTEPGTQGAYECAESANAYTRAERARGNRQRASARTYEEYDHVG